LPPLLQACQLGLCCQQELCQHQLLLLVPFLLPFLLHERQFCLLLYWPLQRAGRQARVSLALQGQLLQGHWKLLQTALLLLVLAAVGAVCFPVQLQVPAVLQCQLCWEVQAAVAVQEQVACSAAGLRLAAAVEEVLCC
jgi:hypothetical protein